MSLSLYISTEDNFNPNSDQQFILDQLMNIRPGREFFNTCKDLSVDYGHGICHGFKARKLVQAAWYDYPGAMNLDIDMKEEFKSLLDHVNFVHWG